MHKQYNAETWKNKPLFAASFWFTFLNLNETTQLFGLEWVRMAALLDAKRRTDINGYRLSS